MRIGCLQYRPEFGDPEGNVTRIGGMIRGREADLVVLPELATTGYLFSDVAEARSLAETVPDGPTTQRFLALCREEGFHLCFGLPERDGDAVYNTVVLLGPEGILSIYRKVHLFADEFDIFAPGNLGFPVTELPGGVRIGLMICFDWVFPEAARLLALAGADVILHPSNLVLPYCQEAMKTRSLENGVFTVTANRVGLEERAGRGPLHFSGMSQVVSPRGEVLGRLGGNREGLLLLEIDPEKARDKMLTHTNDVLADRRPEQYGALVEKESNS